MSSGVPADAAVEAAAKVKYAQHQAEMGYDSGDYGWDDESPEHQALLCDAVRPYLAAALPLLHRQIADEIEVLKARGPRLAIGEEGQDGRS